MERFCDYHQVFTHPTAKCDALRRRIEDMIENKEIEGPKDTSTEEDSLIGYQETLAPQIMMINSGLT
ncbi:hypothetical protein M5689_024609 [Euphorbia peplus]|nr:hypothetical protein M5689_024609 [Euphorbia peplus]